MTRLKDRNRQIPNGFRFMQPETGWKSSPFASFDTIVNGLIAHRRANPYHTQKFNWSTDYDGVALEVDAYNAFVCARMGWNDYITADETTPPKWVPPPSRPSVLKAAAAGAETLKSWLGDDGKPVDQDEADERAVVCLTCPQNQPAQLGDLFTVAAQAFIHKQLEHKNEMKLATAYDEKLGVCQACLCPLKLKVWTPMQHILAKMPPDVKARLDPGCWITK